MTWLTDNIMSIALLLILALIVFLIIRSKVKAGRSGKAVAAAVPGAAAVQQRTGSTRISNEPVRLCLRCLGNKLQEEQYEIN